LFSYLERGRGAGREIKYDKKGSRERKRDKERQSKNESGHVTHTNE